MSLATLRRRNVVLLLPGKRPGSRGADSAMLPALAIVLAGVAGQTGSAAMPFGPNLGYWRFSARNSEVSFSCRLMRRDAFLGGSCLGAGFKSDGLAYGVVDGSEVHVSIYFERSDDDEVSFDFAGNLSAVSADFSAVKRAGCDHDDGDYRLRWGAY